MSADFDFGQEEIKQFNKDGYFVIENFLTTAECDNLRQRCHDIVEEEDFSKHPVIAFNTRDNEQASTDYFINSGDKIRYFFEEAALNDEGKPKVSEHLALNKIGHALHELDPEFKKVTTSDKMIKIAKCLDLKHPTVVQSMYIFKQPSHGGAVLPHQDSTFLHTDPNTLTGIWIALEDADVENSCLWFAPGSHKKHTNTTRRALRTIKDGAPAVKFEGSDPVVNDEEFVVVPVKKGSLVLIHGCVVHKSEKNISKRSRHIYTFHVFDKGVSKYSEDNWLQPTDVVPFKPLY